MHDIEILVSSVVICVDLVHLFLELLGKHSLGFFCDTVHIGYVCVAGSGDR